MPYRPADAGCRHKCAAAPAHPPRGWPPQGDVHGAAPSVGTHGVRSARPQHLRCRPGVPPPPPALGQRRWPAPHTGSAAHPPSQGDHTSRAASLTRRADRLPRPKRPRPNPSLAHHRPRVGARSERRAHDHSSADLAKARRCAAGIARQDRRAVARRPLVANLRENPPVTPDRWPRGKGQRWSVRCRGPGLRP